MGNKENIYGGCATRVVPALISFTEHHPNLQTVIAFTFSSTQVAVGTLECNRNYTLL